MADVSGSKPPAWVGPEYGKGPRRRRLLLLSLKEPLEPGAIARVGLAFDASFVARYIDGTMKHQTFTDVARLMLGDPASRPLCEQFWREVAFANLEGPSGGTRAHPLMTRADLESSAQLLEALVREHAPTVFVLFDAALAEALADFEPAASLLRERKHDWISLPHPGTPGFRFRDHASAAVALWGDEKNSEIRG